MRRTLLLIVAAGAMVGMASAWSCSSTNPLGTFLRNLTAAQCDDQTATLANLPLGILTPAQGADLLAKFCAGAFGTAPAPTPAPGNQPAIPGASEVPAK